MFLTKTIYQLDADRYLVYDDLKTSWLVNIDLQNCNCGVTNCKHLQAANKFVYRKVMKKRQDKKRRGF